MTHRNSPDVVAYDINLTHPHIFLIKRILEYYVMASKYINEILDMIEKDVMESFQTEQ